MAGVALLLIAAGGVLITAGIRDVSPLHIVAAILNGQKVPAGSIGNGQGPGAAGVPGGPAATANGTGGLGEPNAGTSTAGGRF